MFAPQKVWSDGHLRGDGRPGRGAPRQKSAFHRIPGRRQRFLADPKRDTTTRFDSNAKVFLRNGHCSFPPARPNRGTHFVTHNDTTERTFWRSSVAVHPPFGSPVLGFDGLCHARDFLRRAAGVGPTAANWRGFATGRNADDLTWS